MKNKIFILTAVHNDLEDTKKLLKSIFFQTFKNFEVYLIDDGSTDGTSDYIRKNYPEVNVLKGNGNLWWTGSLNFGLMRILKIASNKDFVWIINNDCFFAEDILQNLMSYEESSKGIRNIIGSVIFDSNTKKIIDNGVTINWKRMEFMPGGSDALSTKGTLYPVRVFKEVGLFDVKHFPHYFSDYEYSIRAKRKGYKLLTCGKSRICNKIERTGIEKIPQGISPTEMFRILFSRKSKLNLLTQINIVGYVCPPEYRLKNYFLLISKLIHAKK